MATLEIDGIGKVDIDDAFLKLTPEQQAVEVDAIAAQIARAKESVEPTAPQCGIRSIQPSLADAGHSAPHRKRRGKYDVA